MAVHDSLPGIEVTVRVDGEPLKEYHIENGKAKHGDRKVAAHEEAWTIANYIESSTSQTFTVDYAIEPPYKFNSPGLTFFLFVDGQKVHSRHFSRKKYRKCKWVFTAKGPQAITSLGATFMPMQFAEIQSTCDTVDSSTIKTQKDLMHRVGEIVVKIYRVSASTPAIAKTTSTFQESDYSKKYHNKVLVQDGKSHGVTLGIAKPIKLPSRSKSTKLDGDDFPIAIFRFKYRSSKALKDLQVIPRTPSLSPEPEPRAATREDSPNSDLDGLDDLTPEQRKRVEKLLKRKKGGIKAEKAESEATSTLTIKPDHSDDDVKPGNIKSFKKPKKMIGKTTIDLTEDDDEVKAPVISLD